VLLDPGQRGHRPARASTSTAPETPRACGSPPSGPPARSLRARRPAATRRACTARSSTGRRSPGDSRTAGRCRNPDEHVRRERGEDIEEERDHVVVHEDAMRSVREDDVARANAVPDREVRRLQWDAHNLVAGGIDLGPRVRVDRCDVRAQPTVGDRPSGKACRVARSGLDVVGRFPSPNRRVDRGAVETGQEAVDPAPSWGPLRGWVSQTAPSRTWRSIAGTTRRRAGRPRFAV
jgi:hypothetical protein